MTKPVWDAEDEAIRQALHAEAQANLIAEFERRKRSNGDWWVERIRLERLARGA